MAQEDITFNVLQGPSKSDLQIALFHGDFYGQVKVAFRLEATPETRAKTYLSQNVRLAKHLRNTRILSAQREDGTGESWILQGSVEIDNTFVFFSGNYSTKCCHGRFTLMFEPASK